MAQLVHSKSFMGFEITYTRWGSVGTNLALQLARRRGFQSSLNAPFECVFRRIPTVLRQITALEISFLNGMRQFFDTKIQ